MLLKENALFIVIFESDKETTICDIAGQKAWACIPDHQQENGFILECISIDCLCAGSNKLLQKQFTQIIHQICIERKTY